jgi:hypothetical protein
VTAPDRPELRAGAAADDPTAPPYNTIYERLVRDDDLVGLDAYAIYKQSKRDWIKRHYQRHGVRPTPEPLDDYFDRYSDADLSRFRE